MSVILRMPSVSIIVPCYNEQATIRLVLEAIYQQSFPLIDLEVVIADGLSTDLTRRIIEKFQNEHPDLDIQIIDNQKRTISAGLNLAIEASKGEYIIRLDAHSIPGRNYVNDCIESLEAGKGDNVGGVWDIKPQVDTWIAKSIAAAASHPLGVGDARYRLGGDAQLVDTVPFGAFRRSLIKKIGYFNESLLTNEDYEFNVRVRTSGGRVWMDPKIRSQYFTRPTLKALARQYGRYGYWKAQMLRENMGTIRWRQLLPPFLVFSIIILIAGSLMFPKLWPWLFLVLGLYIFTLLLVGIQVSIKSRFLPYVLGVPLAIATMHLVWGSTFLWGLPTRRNEK